MFEPSMLSSPSRQVSRACGMVTSSRCQLSHHADHAGATDASGRVSGRASHLCVAASCLAALPGRLGAVPSHVIAPSGDLGGRSGHLFARSGHLVAQSAHVIARHSRLVARSRRIVASSPLHGRRQRCSYLVMRRQTTKVTQAGMKLVRARARTRAHDASMTQRR